MLVVDAAPGARFCWPVTPRSDPSGHADRGRGTSSCEQEQRPAVVRPDRQRRCRSTLARSSNSGPLPSHGDRRRIDRIARRGGRAQHVGDQALVPTADLASDAPAVVRAPVPVEQPAAALRVPAPFHLLPERVDADREAPFSTCVSAPNEILPRCTKAQDEERGLDQSPPSSLRPNGIVAAGPPVEEMGQRAMIAGPPATAHPAPCRSSRTSASSRETQPRSTADDDRHDAEARSADRDRDFGARSRTRRCDARARGR